MEEKASILIVDDDTSLCRSMSLVLGRKGYTVATAADGPEAIDMVRERTFDMVFMDIKMPVMDGVETHRRIKEIRPDATVMMMTAYTVEELVRQALQDGAYGIIYKPLDMEKVVAIIEESRESTEGALILVVDDEPELCNTLESILAKRGYKIGIAHTGEEAIDIAQQQDYSIILIDIKLPTISGLDTYLAIKEINPKAMAVMMTGHRHEVADLAEEAIRNNAYTCLYKPIDMHEMLRLIEGIRQRIQKAG
ncbi:MAG: response regulator [Dehalococcoidia bacterium]|nr:response regulator [Dehalococcoidia bacterium]